MERSFQIRRILFPTDFSNSSEAAARYVSGLAREIGASILVLHVVPAISQWHGASEPYYNDLGPEALRAMVAGQRTAEQAGARTLESFRRAHFDGICTQALIRSGGVAASIVECADDFDADLIVMPTRGWGPLRRFLIGSATAKVLHDTSHPVWTSPHAAELGDYHPYRNIVCATDYRVLSRDLLARADSVARLFNARLTIVSAVPVPAANHQHGWDLAAIEAIRHETELTIKKNLEELAIDAPVDILGGSVGEVVRRAAVFGDADLVIIGHGHLSEQMGHLRTHAYEIIWNAPCPVLAV